MFLAVMQFLKIVFIQKLYLYKLQLLPLLGFYFLIPICFQFYE